jgi:glucokinase
MVQDHFGVPVVLGNDANLAALGEHAYGAGRGVSDMIYMTVSTGIGGGIISDGELFLGSHGYAGEIGHQTILVDGPLCGCGNHGCLEALAAGPAIGRMGQEAAAQGVAPYLLELGCGHPQQVTGRHVTQAAREGDGPAVEIIARAGRYIGMGLANLANILNPSLFVIGGGVSTVGNVLFDAVRASLSCSAMYATRDVTVVPAGLGEDVGLLGAVELISRALSRR